MGIREIRYCDLTGSEHDVESHELNIDQMRVQIDLAGPEYRKLLSLLQPYIDAGRVDASIPDLRPAKRAGGQVSTSTGLTAEEREQLRQWAEDKGIEVPSNNRFKRSLVDQWREERAAEQPA
ncbi:Lsr2 family protein [Pseudonocardia sp. RS11V-5]|uniref:Lsr2 dimerization domain-containing protein n=1 Tax=Pseudonocardia terrae TaxID=2905831 RepID=UPI001E5AB17C|nr:histone-like nucleoid-structuring protein Lsr2 [Pseudonocardia terrae]MCE3551065.1 Lsr2 family protein [Pseudonocardia terrae]